MKYVEVEFNYTDTNKFCGLLPRTTGVCGASETACNYTYLHIAKSLEIMIENGLEHGIEKITIATDDKETVIKLYHILE